MVWDGGVVAHEILVSAQGPLVFGFGAKCLGPVLVKKPIYQVSSRRYRKLRRLRRSPRRAPHSLTAGDFRKFYKCI